MLLSSQGLLVERHPRHWAMGKEGRIIILLSALCVALLVRWWPDDVGISVPHTNGTSKSDSGEFLALQKQEVSGRLSLTERKGLVAFDSFPSCSFSLSAPLKRHFLPHASFQGLTVFASFVETNRRWGPQQLMTLLESSFSVCLTSVSESEWEQPRAKHGMAPGDREILTSLRIT